MRIYELLKLRIKRGGYSREDMLQKLDAYLLIDRITLDQYNELVAMMEV